MSFGHFSSGGGVEVDGAAAFENEVGVAGGGAVGDHGDGQVGGVGGPVEDFDVEHGGEAAEALGTDAESVDAVVEVDAETLDVGLGAAGFELLHVDGVHEGLLGEEHGFLGGAADADAEHAGGTPAGAHGGDGFEDPVDDGIGGVEHDELGFGLGASALGGDGDVDGGAGDERDFDDAGVLSMVLRRLKAGSRRMEPRSLLSGSSQAWRTPSSQICWQGERGGGTVGSGELHGHAELDEDGDDAGVLADGAVALGAHAGVDEDLRDGVLGGVRLLDLVGAGEVGDVVLGVVEADVLEGGANALDEVGLGDLDHAGSMLILATAYIQWVYGLLDLQTGSGTGGEETL